MTTEEANKAFLHQFNTDYTLKEVVLNAISRQLNRQANCIRALLPEEVNKRGNLREYSQLWLRFIREGRFDVSRISVSGNKPTCEY
jgi:hypothetical protein